MEIKYRIFEELNKRGITAKEFQTTLGIGGSVLDRLRHNQNTNVETLGKICQYFGCTLNDIVEFPDDNADKNAERKKEILSQLSELQEKTRQLQDELKTL